MTVRMAFTRPADKLEESIELAESLGMSVLAAPSLKILDGTDAAYGAAESVLTSGFVDYAVFGSGTAVEACCRRWGDEKFSTLFSGCSVVSIGPHTSDVLRAHGVRAGMMPQDDYSSYGVVGMLSERARGRTIILVRSDSGTDVLRDGLSKAGAKVVEFAAYRLEKAGMTDELSKIMDSIGSGELDVMAFTSPMSASMFVEEMRGRFGDRADGLLSGVKLAAIGKPTSQRLAELGHPPDIVPEKTTFKDMLEAIAASGRRRHDDS
jgi:uroporphyrinogen-III synthase